jgi:4-amino-4-deoxy-L-arabinose transferase-like glycosyltransferase
MEGKKPVIVFDRRLFFGVLIVFTIFKLFYATRIPITGDEAYHWEWSRHLALGYYDHPPLVAWLIAFFTAIGGNSLLWTRLTALICVTGTSYFTYRFGRELGGGRVGVGAGLFSLAANAMMIGSILVSTDSPLLFFWQLTLFLVWRALKTRQGGYWYLAGVALGFGLLSKFLIVPLIPGIFLFLLLSAEDRFWLRRKEPYLAAIVALLIFAPFIYWNSQNGWTTFVFQFVRHELSINWLRPFEYLSLQTLLFGPVLYGVMLWSIYRLFVHAFKGGKDPGTGTERRISIFILSTGWLLPGFLFFDSIRNETSGHWPLAAYGGALVGLALVLSRRKRELGRQKEGKVLGPWILGLTLLWTAVFVATTLNPDWLKGLKVRNHTVNEGYGWEEIGQVVSRLHHQTGDGNLIATSSYALSSTISFYTPDHLYVSLLGPGSVHGRAYDIWDRWPEWVGRNVLFISADDPNRKATTARKILKESCKRFKVLTTIDIKRQGEVVRRFYCTMGYDLKQDPYASIRKEYRW